MSRIPDYKLVTLAQTLRSWTECKNRRLWGVCMVNPWPEKRFPSFSWLSRPVSLPRSLMILHYYCNFPIIVIIFFKKSKVEKWTMSGWMVVYEISYLNFAGMFERLSNSILLSFRTSENSEFQKSTLNLIETAKCLISWCQRWNMDIEVSDHSWWEFMK